MKIHILTNIKDCVDGYTPILLNNENIQLDYPDNSVTSILLIEGIEQIDYKNIDTFLINLRRLLRINGKIVIGGIDSECLSRDLVNGSIDNATFNNIIFSKKGIYSSKDLIDKISKLGLKLEKITIKGAVYELHATRPS